MWAVDRREKLIKLGTKARSIFSLLFQQAVKIIKYRMRNKNSDDIKTEALNVDTLIQEIKEK